VSTRSVPATPHSSHRTHTQRARLSDGGRDGYHLAAVPGRGEDLQL